MSNIQRDLIGSFNGMMQDAFIVVLSEISRKDVHEGEGKLRDLITAPEIQINKKGIECDKI